MGLRRVAFAADHASRFGPGNQCYLAAIEFAESSSNLAFPCLDNSLFGIFIVGWAWNVAHASLPWNDALIVAGAASEATFSVR